jgi:hypothetical protein
MFCWSVGIFVFSCCRPRSSNNAAARGRTISRERPAAASPAPARRRIRTYSNVFCQLIAVIMQLSCVTRSKLRDRVGAAACAWWLRKCSGLVALTFRAKLRSASCLAGERGCGKQSRFVSWRHALVWASDKKAARGRTGLALLRKQSERTGRAPGTQSYRVSCGVGGVL